MKADELISLRQIRYFVAVCDHGSITGAAIAMNVSQPAVGMQIKQLEALLDLALFDRTSLGVRPTEAGRILLKHSRNVLNTLKNVREEIGGLANVGGLRTTLGMTTTSGRELIDPILAAARARRRGSEVRISFREGKSDELLELLQEKKIEAALSYEDEPAAQFEIIPLYKEEFVLVGTPEALKGRRGAISFAEISKFPLVISPAEKGSRRFLESTASKCGVRLNVDLEMSSVLLKQEMLLQNGRCMIVPKARFFVEVEAGQLAMLRFAPVLPRMMKLFLRRDVCASVQDFLRSTIAAIVEPRLGSARLGWERPGLTKSLNSSA